MDVVKYKTRIFNFLFKLLQTNSTAEAIAAGFTIGSVIALLPTPFFGVFLGVLATILFKKINKLAVAAAFTVWNPLVQAPLYWLSYMLGGLLFKPDPTMKFDLAIFDQLYHYSSRFLLGNLLIVIILTPLIYLAAYRLAQLFLASHRMQTLVRKRHLQSLKRKHQA
jgi:hypothetical protein